eukprot:454057-Hanusia_phi.AAC.3
MRYVSGRARDALGGPHPGVGAARAGEAGGCAPQGGILPTRAVLAGSRRATRAGRVGEERPVVARPADLTVRVAGHAGGPVAARGARGGGGVVIIAVGARGAGSAVRAAVAHVAVAVRGVGGGSRGEGVGCAREAFADVGGLVQRVVRVRGARLAHPVGDRVLVVARRALDTGLAHVREALQALAVHLHPRARRGDAVGTARFTGRRRVGGDGGAVKIGGAGRAVLIRVGCRVGARRARAAVPVHPVIPRIAEAGGDEGLVEVEAGGVRGAGKAVALVRRRERVRVGVVCAVQAREVADRLFVSSDRAGRAGMPVPTKMAGGTHTIGDVSALAWACGVFGTMLTILLIVGCLKYGVCAHRASVTDTVVVTRGVLTGRAGITEEEPGIVLGVVTRDAAAL